jgi:hypothetical protein
LATPVAVDVIDPFEDEGDVTGFGDNIGSYAISVGTLSEVMPFPPGHLEGSLLAE